MSPHEPHPPRELDVLNRLAEQLFAVVRNAVPPERGSPMPPLDRCDRLLDRAMGDAEYAQLTLLCAQLLFVATATPEESEPRVVAVLTDAADVLLTRLTTSEGLDGKVRERLHDLQGTVTALGLRLLTQADPGSPRYTDG